MTRKHKHRILEDQEDSSDHGPGERLQKVLAAAGVGSRRDCEELIRDGRVEVDRQVVTQMGTRVDPLRQEIRVDGEALRQPQRLYYAVNKPVGVVTTNFDPAGRSRVIDLVPTEERVFAVGRIDRSSEGLILVTNDGEFANRITHPRYGVEKTYLVRVAGAPNQQQLARLKRGVHLAEGFAKAQSIAVKKRHGQSTDLVIVLNEGRNREIRRILARVGHKVLTLKRVAIGPIKLGDLVTGGWRRLLPQEIEALLQVAKEKRREAKRRKKGIGARGQGTGEQARSEVGGQRSESGDQQYLQKQALLAEPLSLDDLLRDDLDEGPLGLDDATDPTGGATDQGGVRGGVIDYADEEGQASPRRQPQDRRAGHRARRGPRGHGKRPRGDLESRPREDFGKKRGGKRIFSPPLEGRGPAGETAGKVGFRPKKGKKKWQDRKRREGPAPFAQGKPKQKFGKGGRRGKGRR
jgi:23S rRNA pseudouridine2605 synthase